MGLIRSIPLGLRYMAAGALAFSLMSALSKLAGASVPLFEIVLARSLVMVVLAGVHLRRKRISFRGNERGILLVRGVLGFVGLTCFYYAVIRLPLADATVFHFTNPVFTALVAAVVLGEHVGLLEAGLVLLSLGGVVMVARPAFLFGSEAALDPVAVLVGLTGALFAAGAYVSVRRLRNEVPMVVVFYFAAVSTALSLPMVVFDPMLPSPRMLLVLLGVGLATHLGQIFITLGYRAERAGRASSIGYLQIVFAAGWGWLMFGHVPDPWTWAGAGVIVLSTALLVRFHRVR
jgi:drug/metabolite transporter (DMT)-like permease